LNLTSSRRIVCVLRTKRALVKGNLRDQLIVDVLQVDRAPARTLCLDLLPLLEELQAHRICGGAVSLRRGRSGEAGNNDQREQRSEDK
jgi:hypothetical protein